jgi:hypothetical protein
LINALTHGAYGDGTAMRNENLNCTRRLSFTKIAQEPKIKTLTVGVAFVVRASKIHFSLINEQIKNAKRCFYVVVESDYSSDKLSYFMTASLSQLRLLGSLLFCAILI